MRGRKSRKELKEYVRYGVYIVDGYSNKRGDATVVAIVVALVVS